MREFLTNGVVGNIELNEQRRVRGMIMERWEGLNFLEGLEGHTKENIATVTIVALAKGSIICKKVLKALQPSM